MEGLVSRARNTRDGVGHRNRFAVLQCRFHGSKKEHVTCQHAWREQNRSFRLVGQGFGGGYRRHPPCYRALQGGAAVSRFGTGGGEGAGRKGLPAEKERPAPGGAGRGKRRARHDRRQTVGTEGGCLKMSWMPGMGGLRVRHGPKVILDESSYMRSGPYLNSDLRMSSHWTSPPL